MNDPIVMRGRDPRMDRAIARIATRLYDFEADASVDPELATQLQTAARGLWAAWTGLEPKLPPHSCDDLGAAVRQFVVECKQAEHRALRGQIGSSRQDVHAAFAEVVRRYRRLFVERRRRRVLEVAASWSQGGHR